MDGRTVGVSGKGEGVCLCVWIGRNDRMHDGSSVGRGGVCTWVCVGLIVTNEGGVSVIWLTCDRQMIGRVVVGALSAWGDCILSLISARDEVL